MSSSDDVEETASTSSQRITRAKALVLTAKTVKPAKTVKRLQSAPIIDPIMTSNDEIPKRKRGRPKKVGSALTT